MKIMRVSESTQTPRLGPTRTEQGIEEGQSQKHHHNRNFINDSRDS